MKERLPRLSELSGRGGGSVRLLLGHLESRGSGSGLPLPRPLAAPPFSQYLGGSCCVFSLWLAFMCLINETGK